MSHLSIVWLHSGSRYLSLGFWAILIPIMALFVPVAPVFGLSVHKVSSPVQLGPVRTNFQPTIISFRLDDITFESGQRNLLLNVVKLARKYHITFDLGVIAEPFDRYADPDVYRIYEKNRDVLEIVAHGYDHTSPLGRGHSGEFYDLTGRRPIAEKIQEDHLRRMSNIFRHHGLGMAQRIFILPWSAGDKTTIQLAGKFGYQMVVQDFLPDSRPEDLVGSVLATRVFIYVLYMLPITDREVGIYKQQIRNYVRLGYRRIEIELHEKNFLFPGSVERLIAALTQDNSTSLGGRVLFAPMSAYLHSNDRLPRSGFRSALSYVAQESSKKAHR